MSIASPKNRAEMKEYILTKLGHPVLQINVSDEQMDIAINDAFQYWNERSHFLGTERMYITFTADKPFVEHFGSFENELVPQKGGPTLKAEGMISTLTLVTPGSGYAPTPGSSANPSRPTRTLTGSGSNCTVYCGTDRTVSGGLISVQPYITGSGYAVGDQIAVTGSSTGDEAVFQVATIKEESPAYGVANVRKQNNFIIMPDDVVGITQVLHRPGFGYGGDIGGIIPGAALGPMFLGGLLGDECMSIGYGIVSYVAMREYLATLSFLFQPPIQYNFNQRTHRLFIDSDRWRGGGGLTSGDMVCVEAMVKPNPDIYPDCYNDMWLKEYAVALVQLNWGRNLTKYNQVQLPGGITMNGDQILQSAVNEIAKLKERFSMDWADPPLDAVG